MNDNRMIVEEDAVDRLAHVVSEPDNGLNWKIAHHTGWEKLEYSKLDDIVGWRNGEESTPWPENQRMWYQGRDGKWLGPVPKFASDLNAMAFIEKHYLTGDELGEYLDCLRFLVKAKPYHVFVDKVMESDEFQQLVIREEFRLITPTARQRAEAFLAVKGRRFH